MRGEGSSCIFACSEKHHLRGAIGSVASLGNVGSLIGRDVFGFDGGQRGTGKRVIAPGRI
jgi:hypothetical protein